MTHRLLYLVSHPIQYQAPLLRLIAATDDIDLRVVFATDATVGAHHDPGFGATIAWRVPLTEGYAFAVEPRTERLADHITGADAVWLHGWQGRRMRRALGFAHRAGVPVLMRGENTLAAMPDRWGPRGMLKRRFLAAIFDRCLAFLTVGAANEAYYRAHGVDPARLFAMPYAVDNAFFRAGAAAAEMGREAFRAELGLEPDRPVMLYAGKLLGRKNPDVLIAAFAALDRARLGRPYLLFVGEGEMRARLERRTAGDADIRFLGFQDQRRIAAFYDLADVFVLASHREPWGLAVNEAMNGACAVVVSDQCGCAPDLVDADCGVVVRPGDAAALATALDGLLADRDRLRRMGEASAARIAGWSFDADLDGLRAALATVTGLKPRRGEIT